MPEATLAAMSTTVKPSGATGVRSTVRPWPAVLALAVAAPLIAEISLGSLPVSKVWMLLFFGYIYSAAALLIREAVRRRHLGVSSTLALELAFGLVEEGLALGSMTSTTLYPVADWAPRLLGFNTAYSLWVLPYHAVFSIVVPVAIVDLIFPKRIACTFAARADRDPAGHPRPGAAGRDHGRRSRVWHVASPPRAQRHIRRPGMRPLPRRDSSQVWQASGFAGAVLKADCCQVPSRPELNLVR